MYEFLHSEEDNQTANRGGDHVVNHLSQRNHSL